jgi:hypothetical protein
MQFNQLKLRLEKLDQTIIKEYSSKIYRVIRPDESDALALNYSVFDNGPYTSNLAIVFKDVTGPSRFDVGLIKAIDIESIRHYLKKVIAESVPIEEVEQNISTYVFTALEFYHEWDKLALLNGQRIDFPR